MRWKNMTKNLGRIVVGKKQTVVFQANETLDIANITSSCGCTKPFYSKSKNQISVEFTPGKIPIHLALEGQYTTTKTVTVYYKDGSKDILSIKANVRRSL